MKKFIKKNLVMCLLICGVLLVFLNYKFDFINEITMKSSSQSENEE